MLNADKKLIDENHKVKVKEEAKRLKMKIYMYQVFNT